MKFSKFSLGFLAVALLAFVPASVMSKGTDKETITLTSDNTIVLNEQVDGESVGKVISEAKKLNAGLTRKLSSKPIYLVLNTPGGSIQAGMELIEALSGMDRPVHTITQFAASMGFQIAQNMKTRYITSSGVLMSHHAKGGFEGEFGGESSQVQSRLALWTERVNELDRKTVNRTGGKQTLQSYQRAYTPELWLTGAQSVEGGYADQVVQVKCDSSLDGTTQHTAVVMGIIPVSYELDNCPLNTSPLNVKVGIATTKGYTDSEAFLNTNGGFGPDCLLNVGKPNFKDFCALDTSLNMGKIRELKTQFVNEYKNNMRRVVDKF